MTYTPQLNHYVKYGHIEGWVYFVDEEYLTIETNVRPKDEINYLHCSLHANERVLVVCYRDDWNELQHIKSREVVYEEEKNLVSSYR